jgi:hypothetical protein
VMFTPRTVSSVTIMVMQAAGAATGLAEVEAVAANLPPPPPRIRAIPPRRRRRAIPSRRVRSTTSRRRQRLRRRQERGDRLALLLEGDPRADARRHAHPRGRHVHADDDGSPVIDCQSNAKNGTPTSPSRSGRRTSGPRISRATASATRST